MNCKISLIIPVFNEENEINNFKQVCPVEMLDKLENPITLKDSISKAV